MNSRHNSDQQKYRDAGEQAAHVIGEFMSIANDFSRRFGGGFPEPGPANEESHKSYRGSHDADSTTTDSTSDDRTTYNAADGIQQAGEYLRELREAAGYSIDGFAQAMNRQNAATKIESVEAGRDVFPKDWLEQISALLKQNDPIEFIDKLRKLYDVEQSAGEPTDNSVNDRGGDHGLHAASNRRRDKLNEIFTDDTLEGLTDSQFEELSGFIKTNYLAALQLVGKKSHD